MRATFWLSVLVPCMLTVFAPAMSAEHSRLTILPVTKGGGVNSAVFYVSAVGTVKVDLSVRTAAMFNTGGRSAYLVSVRRGVPIASSLTGTEVANRRVLANSEKTSASLDVPIPTCAGVGAYHVRVSNVSTDNPQQGIVSLLDHDNTIAVTTPNPGGWGLDMAGISVLDLERGHERTVDIGSIGRQGGINLRAKWHVPGLIPTFKQVRIYLMRPNGSVAKSGMYYSFHSPMTPQLNIGYNVTAADAQQTGQWKLRIVNPGDTRIEGFNIKKGTDPFVPAFNSTFVPSCGG